MPFRPQSLAALALLLAPFLPAQTSDTGRANAPGEHQVILNGVRLWYKLAGQPHPGVAPVLYLAGGPGYNSYSFEHTIGIKLEPHAQMLYFDERGTGRSERPWDHDYKMSTLTSDIEALRVLLNLPQLTLMGQSFGGTIALEYAARYPEHVQKIVLVDGAADIPDVFAYWQTEMEARYPQAWHEAMETDDGKALTAAAANANVCALTKARFQVEMDVSAKVNGAEFHHWQQFHDQRFRKQQDAQDDQSGLQNTGELEGAYFSPGNEFLCYRFAAYDRLTMPVLVLGGKYDGSLDIAQMHAVAQHLKHAQFIEFENSAHFPYAEEPEKFEHDVLSFLDE